MKNLSLRIALTALGLLSCGQPASAKAKPKTRKSPKIHKTDKGSTVGALVKGGLAGGVLGLGYLALNELLEDPKTITWTPTTSQSNKALSLIKLRERLAADAQRREEECLSALRSAHDKVRPRQPELANQHSDDGSTLLGYGHSDTEGANSSGCHPQQVYIAQQSNNGLRFAGG